VFLVTSGGGRRSTLILAGWIGTNTSGGAMKGRTARGFRVLRCRSDNSPPVLPNPYPAEPLTPAAMMMASKRRLETLLFQLVTPLPASRPAPCQRNTVPSGWQFMAAPAPWRAFPPLSGSLPTPSRQGPRRWPACYHSATILTRPSPSQRDLDRQEAAHKYLIRWAQVFLGLGVEVLIIPWS
jgi:hypothetical protein